MSTEKEGPSNRGQLARVYSEQTWRLYVDYVAVAELLTSAGNEIEPRFLEVADGPLWDWLEERLG